MPAEPSAMLLFLFVFMMGALVQATTGFGFGIVTMGVMPYVISDYLAGTALTGLGGLLISLMVAVRNFKKARLKIMAPVIVGYAIFNAAAIKAATVISGGALTKALGVMLIFISLYFMFCNDKIRIKPTFINGVIAGALAGIGAGMFSIGGPPVVIYLLSAIEDKEVYRATSLTYFTVSGTISTTTRFITGIITAEVIKLFLPSIAAVLIGCYIGGRIFKRINVALLKKIIYVFIAISGVSMLF